MRTRATCLALAVSATLLAACGGGGGPSGGTAGAGGGGASAGQTLRVFVTDAPFPFDSVESATVVIEEVRVHERGGDAWTMVFTGSRSIDLVPLQNGVSELLVEAAVPPGTYDRVRLIVDAGEVVLKDDAVVEGSHTFSTADGRLRFPSGAQTGIKIGIENDIVVTTRLSGDLVLDFDLSRNFVFNGPVSHAPGVKRVLFTPSVRATNASTAGSLTMRVLSDELTPLDGLDDLPLEGATVRVFDAAADPIVDAPVTTGSTGADGVPTLSLAPGAYQVVVEATGHEPKTVTGITVTLANLTDLGDVTLAAKGEVSGVVMSDGGTTGTADDVVVEGASVEVRAGGTATVVGTATTDASGAFQVSGLVAGTYDVTVAAAGAGGYDTLVVAGVAATLSGGQTYLLHALAVNLTGTVTDASSAPLAGVSVSIENSAGVVVATATTAADGTYAATIATGSYAATFTLGASTLTLPLAVTGASPPSSATLDATL